MWCPQVGVLIVGAPPGSRTAGCRVVWTAVRFVVVSVKDGSAVRGRTGPEIVTGQRTAQSRAVGDRGVVGAVDDVWRAVRGRFGCSKRRDGWRQGGGRCVGQPVNVLHSPSRTRCGDSVARWMRSCSGDMVRRGKDDLSARCHGQNVVVGGAAVVVVSILGVVAPLAVVWGKRCRPESADSTKRNGHDVAAVPRKAEGRAHGQEGNRPAAFVSSQSDVNTRRGKWVRRLDITSVVLAPVANGKLRGNNESVAIERANANFCSNERPIRRNARNDRCDGGVNVPYVGQLVDVRGKADLGACVNE